MKVNKLEKFFPEISGDVNFGASKYRSTIITRGDLIKVYAESDSSNADDWHIEPTSQDKWWKMSFDGGISFPLKMQFAGSSAMLSHDIEIDSNTQNLINIPITENYDLLKTGKVIVHGIKLNGFKREITDFEYQFDDTLNELNINFDANILSSFSSVNVTVSTGNDGSVGYAIESPVYVNQISAIPSVLNDDFGICNYLDNDIPSIETVTKLSQVTGLKLKVISADSLMSGNVVLKFICGSTIFTQTISVSAVQTEVDIALPGSLNGNLVIERLYDDVNDTLNDRLNNIIITLIITDIIAETK